ncbi:MAG: NUDIX hydrolase, partial [Planctomycetota bacterium]
HLRSNPLGHLTGSAFVLDANHRVLLTHHRKLRRWLQLGGHGEGEWDPAAIARREGTEESGLTALRFHPACEVGPGAIRRPFDIDVHPIPARGDEPEHLHLDVRYLLITEDTASTRCEEESLDLRWFTLEEALELPVDHSLIRAFSALRELE